MAMSVEQNLNQAIDEMEERRYLLAVAHLETAIQLPEFNQTDLKHKVYHYLGECYMYLFNYDEAISAFTASLKVTPTPVRTADFVLLADTHALLSSAYEKKATRGERIRSFRLKRGLSLQQLASGLLDKDMLHQIEMNTAYPSQQVLEELAARLQVDMDFQYELETNNEVSEIGKEGC